MKALFAWLCLWSCLFSGRALAQAPAEDFQGVIEPALDSVYMVGIARRGLSGPEVFQFVGTAWVIAEGKLATNAHVAEALLESAHEGRLVAKRSWSDRDELSLSPGSFRIHPAYGPWNARLKRVIVRNEFDPASARSLNLIPVADVAILGVEAGNTAPALHLANPRQVEPKLSEPVVYLGFPHENISGFPTLHAVPGYVTAKTDFFFQRCAWADSYLIHYCGPVVGGASGSPILNHAGQVIGLISAAENNLSAQGERTSFGFAYGQRIDLAVELLREDFLAIQANRDRDWSMRLAQLLLPPDELLEQLAQNQALADGVPQLTAANTVTRRGVVVKQNEPARLQVTLEPGLRYGFLAAAHDGSDVDAMVLPRDSDIALGVDMQTDYFPMVWVGPLEERTAVTLQISAAELLLQDTECSVHIYKYEPQLVVNAGLEQAAGLFFHTTYSMPDDNSGMITWSFNVEQDAQLMFSASSADGYDIDLVLVHNGEIETSDQGSDSIPVVFHTNPAPGRLDVHLQIPTGAAAGALIEVSGLLTSGPKPELIGDGADSAGGQDYERQTEAELGTLLEGMLEAVMEGASELQATLVDQGYAAMEQSSLEIALELPADAVGVLLAASDDSSDIDLSVLQGDEVLATDGEFDGTPIVAITSTDTPLSLRALILKMSAGPTPPMVHYRFYVLTPR